MLKQSSRRVAIININSPIAKTVAQLKQTSTIFNSSVKKSQASYEA